MRIASVVLALCCLLTPTVAPADDGSTGRAHATLLFFNDAHQLSPVADRFGDRGGVARLATLVRTVRREQPATLVLFGGDLAGGTLFGGQFKGEPQVEAMNRLGVDVASFGQHDFDFGTAHTRELVRASRFPWITTNLDEPDGRPFAGLARSRVAAVGGLRIGILGLTDAMDSTTRDGGVRVRALVEAGLAEVERLEKGDPLDAIVAMAQTDTPGAEALLRAIPALDAVLAEEQAEDRTVMVWLGRRPILAPAGNLGTVVRLDLERAPSASGSRAPVTLSARSLPVDGSLPTDPELGTLAADYDRRLDTALAEPVATLAEALPEDGAREGASALGALVAQAFRAHCRSDVGIVTGGSLRAGLPAGQLRRKEIAAVLPFGNAVVCARMNAALLLQALEHGVDGLAAGRGTLLHVAGLHYVADVTAPAGKRVLRVDRNDAALSTGATITVALSSYILAGGDGFDFTGAVPGATSLDVDALAEFLRAAPSPVRVPATDGFEVAARKR